ncbi:MAG: HAMP domain-containing sensor histidine kinase [Eubacteriales bacterium]|nr:HAMP domain-containing sensor histidine kinase [Eubacteriales bacterium]
MHLSLNVKFILAYLAFALLSFLGISTITSHLMLENAVEEKASAFYQEGVYLSEQYVGNYFEAQEDTDARSAIQSQLSSLSVYLDAQIWLIRRDGEIILDSDTSDSSVAGQVIEAFSPVLPGSTYYTTGDFFGMFRTETLSTLIPVTHNYHVRGYIAIHTPMASVVRIKEGYLLSIYITMIFLMILGFLFAAANWLIVYRPLRKLRRASAEYASGNFDYPIAMNRFDELGSLARTMNFMAGALRDSDEDQRKMISNISHDFRSPLTSIKGYVEAMLDGTIPPGMQEKYLNIVLRETERLTGLTSGLLTLNAMDPKQNRLSRTDFDINAVIRNTVASFEGTCTARRITVDLLFSDWHSYVNADVGKIQQVLYNLIDNAIKFSHPDSKITIETTSKYEKIFISVRDTGIGIPRDSLKKIWERFYKTDLSRGKDKKGTGLGLAIVREIIQLHGENINVVSTEGVGTEFIFSLSRAAQETGGTEAEG